MPAAIDWQAGHGWDAVRDRCHGLARLARARLAELTGLEPLTPDAREHFVQMVAAPLPDCDPDALQRRLLAEHGIEVLAKPWNPRPLIRVSCQGYNDESDVDRLVEALKRLL